MIAPIVLDSLVLGTNIVGEFKVEQVANYSEKIQPSE